MSARLFVMDIFCLLSWWSWFEFVDRLNRRYFDVFALEFSKVGSGEIVALLFQDILKI